jgi:hypothetical protein
MTTNTPTSEIPSTPSEANIPPVESHTYSADERNAMRAYLQRTEVRNSTLHRIAIGFVSGAGLMILIPVFFKEIIDGIILVLLHNIDRVFIPNMTGVDVIVALAMYGMVVYPLIVSLALPIYALYALLQDIVHFYFSVYAPGFSEGLMTPTFSLGGLAFSPDEAPEAKREVMRFQYSRREHMRYLMPFSRQRRELYFDHLFEETEGRIIPESRRLERLKAEGILPPDADEHLINQFNTALGITRVFDRPLIEEVAYQEMAIVRNVMYLRRLVLRYIKALLLFVWTMIVSFVMMPFLQEPRLPSFVILSAGYLVWSLLAPGIMGLPVRWMYRHRTRDRIDTQKQIDLQLKYLEYRVWPYINAARIVALVGFIVSIVHLIV